MKRLFIILVTFQHQDQPLSQPLPATKIRYTFWWSWGCFFRAHAFWRPRQIFWRSQATFHVKRNFLIATFQFLDLDEIFYEHLHTRTFLEIRHPHSLLEIYLTFRYRLFHFSKINPHFQKILITTFKKSGSARKAHGNTFI